MAYEKATLESFQKALKANKYDTLGGVRKAISKMSAFSEKEKEQARAMADKHFGASDGGAPAKKAPKSAKKTAKAKKAPKAAKSAKRAATPASSVLATPIRPHRDTSATNTIALTMSDSPGALRWAGAMAGISALAGRTRTAYEEKTYRLAHGEAQAVASDEGRRITSTFDKLEEEDEPAVPALVTAPPPPAVPVQPQYPRIQIPKVDPATLPPEERTQHEALLQAAKVAGIKPADETKQNQVSS